MTGMLVITSYWLVGFAFLNNLYHSMRKVEDKNIIELMEKAIDKTWMFIVLFWPIVIVISIISSIFKKKV